MQLEVTEKIAKILAATPNRELHGQDPKPYCAIKIALDLQSDSLAMFHPELRSLFYKKKEAGADLAEQGSDATELRLKHLGLPVTWNDEQVGGRLIIHYGASEKSHIVLPGIVVSKTKLEPYDGGTIGMECSIICHPDEKQMGRLGMMVGTEIPISIEPPTQEEIDRQRQLDAGDDDPEAE